MNFGKVKNSIKKEFDSKPGSNEKYLKAKIKSYNGKINTNFHNNKIPREGNFAERHSFRRVLGESSDTFRRLCLSAKSPHQEIR